MLATRVVNALLGTAYSVEQVMEKDAVWRTTFDALVRGMRLERLR